MDDVWNKVAIELLNYGVLGLACIVLTIVVIYIYTKQQNFTEERQRAMEDRIDKLEEAQREVSESFKEALGVFTNTITTTMENYKAQTSLLSDVKNQTDKVQWELNIINQKVDKIQEKQDQYGMRG